MPYHNFSRCNASVLKHKESEYDVVTNRGELALSSKQYAFTSTPRIQLHKNLLLLLILFCG